MNSQFDVLFVEVTIAYLALQGTCIEISSQVLLPGYGQTESTPLPTSESVREMPREVSLQSDDGYDELCRVAANLIRILTIVGRRVPGPSLWLVLQLDFPVDPREMA